MATTVRAAALTILLVPSAGLAQTDTPVAQGPKNVPAFEPAFPEQARAPEARSGVTLARETVADGLVHPWGLALTPAGDMLVTERPGRLRLIRADGQVSDPIDGLPDVYASGQGGLLDVAVSPDFANDRTVFWTYAKPMGDGTSATAAARGTLSDDLTTLTDVRDIFVQSPPRPLTITTARASSPMARATSSSPPASTSPSASASSPRTSTRPTAR